MERSLGRILAILAAVAALAGAALLIRPGEDQAYAAPGLPPLTATQMAGETYRLAPTLLEVVYTAFAETTEAGVYDTLATVAASDALETLYLERIGAMKGGGLTEADQTIHEIELLRLDTRQDGERLEIDARWRVVGTVGHDAHTHVRGNVYDAGFVIEPVDGAWRFTAFTLRDVDRTGAGETFRAPDAPSEAG